MIRRLTLAIALVATTVTAQTIQKPAPGYVRVLMRTSAGPIMLALDQRRAPKTTANFLAYVDDQRLDGTEFFRASRSKGAPKLGFIEGGIGTDYRRSLDPVPLEPTSRTGLRHTDGAISMARNTDPNSATGNFSLLVGAKPGMDAHRGDQGYAVFGRVIGGMATVKRILAMATGGGSGEMAGQMLVKPVTILTARRLDGQAHPTGRPRPWLLFKR